MEKVIEARVILDVPFHDTDPMAVVWHGNYFKYFEVARSKLLRSIDYDYPDMRDSHYAYPVIDCGCRFAHPVHYGEKIEVVARVLEYENRLKIGYEVFHVDTGKRVSKGYTVQVAVDMRIPEMLLVSPDILLEKLGVK